MLTALQSLLLDMLSTIRPVSPERFAALSAGQWSQLCRIARQQRVESMLQHQIQSSGLEQHIPTEIEAQWAVNYRQVAIDSLSVQRLLFDLKRILDPANIPFLVLKGAWLAWNVYPHPALRPMRDIDILVREGDALETFRLLSANGFSQTDCHNIPLEFLLKTGKHLPGLACAHSAKKIEIHARLFTPDDKKPCPAALADFDSLYDKRQIFGLENRQIAYPSATDSLLHIIVHSVEDHVFNNGPVVITDVQHILMRGGIGWPHFWAVAGEGGWVSASRLVFDMVEYYHGEQQIDWQGFLRGETPVAVIEAAAAMSLQDVDARSNFALAVDLGRESRPMAKLTRFCQRLVPARYVLADIGNVPMNSPRIYLYYPIWFFRSVRKIYRGSPKEISASSLVDPVIRWLAR